MTGFLFVLALIAAIFYGFGRALRSRTKLNLDRAGVELPPELAATQAARTAAKVSGAPATRPAPGVVAAGTPLPHFVLAYDVVPDFIQRRAAFRDEHLALAWKAAEAGELVLAGALEAPPDQALLLFRGAREAALRFAAADPYVKHGLVKSFKVRQWHTTVGKAAAAPLRPEVVSAGPLK